jgi:hypothetical protein
LFVCAHCKRWIDQAGHYVACDQPTTGAAISHGTCLACGTIYLSDAGVSLPKDWPLRLAKQVQSLQAQVEALSASLAPSRRLAGSPMPS